MDSISKKDVEKLGQLANEDILVEIKDGYGKYYNKYGVLIYEGNFKAGKPFGKCKYYIAGSLAYDGEWLDGKYHGFGKEYELSPDSDMIHKELAEIYLKKYNDIDKAIKYLDSVEETRIVKIMKESYMSKKEQGYIYSGRWKKSK